MNCKHPHTYYVYKQLVCYYCWTPIKDTTIVCPDCEGKGRFEIWHAWGEESYNTAPCKTCKGDGRVDENFNDQCHLF